MSVLQADPADRIQILAEDGSVREDATVPSISDHQLIEMYRDMRLARHFDERAVSLQRQGRMGTFPPLSGQEGAQIGSAHALDPEDWVFPSYREHGVAIVRGVEMHKLLLYWMGHEAGNVLEGTNMFPTCVPIATQIPHATGFSWASKLQGKDHATICYFGDGATSEGDFHEGLNFAGVFDTPTVFCCMNNQWAISVPRERQTASQTLAQKATAYGFDGIQVDGMDPLAMYQVTKAALEQAKSPGDGQLRPTLIEAVQYRFGAHTTADDPSKYRAREDVEEWREKDPIPRFEQFLRDTGRLDDEHVASIENEIGDMVDEAIAQAEESPRPMPAEMFEHAYADVPDDLVAQREHLERLREVHGDDVIRE